jgi:glycerophosphoryl diester phosphodiesterase
VPTLDEALALFARARLRRIYVELKGSPASKEALLNHVIGDVFNHRLEDRVTLLSFDHALVRRAKEASNIRTAATFSPAGGKFMTARSIIRAVEDARADEAAIHFGLVTRRVADALGERGLSLSAWTANNKLIMRRLVSCGVDSIMTNFPNRLFEMLEARARDGFDASRNGGGRRRE